MDNEDHKKTWNNFTKFVLWGTVAVVMVLVLMAIFLLQNKLMKIGSLSENLSIEKRVAITPEIAKKYKLDLAQMSLKFLEIQLFVTSVIIGATTMEQLKTNIESVNINLTKEIIDEINEVQKIYPNPCP